MAVVLVDTVVFLDTAYGSGTASDLGLGQTVGTEDILVQLTKQNEQPKSCILANISLDAILECMKKNRHITKNSFLP